MDIIVPLTAGQTLTVEHEVAHESRLMESMVALDEFLNEELGGKPDETISSHAAIAAEKRDLLGEVLSRMLNFVQKNHGALAAAGDLERCEAEEARLRASGIVKE